MTEQEKELLLKDLCARLPYHVRVKVWLADGDTEEGPLDLQHNYGDVLLDAFYYKKITKIKPYLRPMSSMTEEERNEYLSIKMQETERVALAEIYRPEAISEIMDWLNTHYFDYRGLIEKGLAIEAPEGMYETKTE